MCIQHCYSSASNSPLRQVCQLINHSIKAPSRTKKETPLFHFVLTLTTKMLCVRQRRVKNDKSPYFSIYSVYLADWLAVFPREQVHVIKFEDHIKNQAESFQELSAFLDIGETRFYNISALSNVKALLGDVVISLHYHDQLGSQRRGITSPN